MKLTVTKPVEIEVVTIRVNVPVRYGTEDIPADCPGRRPWLKGDTSESNESRDDRWDVAIDIDSGKVRNWPKGKTAKVKMKVCDEGNYHLYDANGDEVAVIKENYVPSCVPGEYGDYISFDIDKNGVVKNWRCGEDEIRNAFFPPHGD
jgi:hypothetical protein